MEKEAIRGKEKYGFREKGKEKRERRVGGWRGEENKGREEGWEKGRGKNRKEGSLEVKEEE